MSSVSRRPANRLSDRTSRLAQAAKDRIPNGRLEIFDDSGHTPQMEEPDRFNRLVLDFLQEPARRRGEGVA